MKHKKPFKTLILVSALIISLAFNIFHFSQKGESVFRNVHGVQGAELSLNDLKSGITCARYLYAGFAHGPNSNNNQNVYGTIEANKEKSLAYNQYFRLNEDESILEMSWDQDYQGNIYPYEITEKFENSFKAVSNTKGHHYLEIGLSSGTVWISSFSALEGLGQSTSRLVCKPLDQDTQI